MTSWTFVIMDSICLSIYHLLACFCSLSLTHALSLYLSLSQLMFTSSKSISTTIFNQTYISSLSLFVDILCMIWRTSILRVIWWMKMIHLSTTDNIMFCNIVLKFEWKIKKTNFSLKSHKWLYSFLHLIQSILLLK